MFSSLGNKDIPLSNISTANKLEQAKQIKKALELGEIPEPLKWDRESKITQLGNGVRVASDYWPNELVTISIFIKCGSRQETLENSGVAHFLEHLHFKGTKKRSRIQLELDVENMGGQLNAYTSRENTSYTMTVFKKNVEKAMEILGDMLTNSVYLESAVDNERNTIYQEAIETQKDLMETTIESAHLSSFKDHIMGQPILGRKENIGNITRKQIVEYHDTHYRGPNICVIGAGDISHERLEELADKYFGKLTSQPVVNEKNKDKPNFTPGTLFLRDDEMTDTNVGVFWEAPGWTHEDYYAFLLLQRVLGEYTPETASEFKPEFPDPNFNTMNSILCKLPGINMSKSIYAPYSDTGLFGTYYNGDQANIYQMYYTTQAVLSGYASYINDIEVIRAKNQLYSELLQHETGNDMTQSLGNQLVYLNRQVPRSEIAKRISSFDAKHLSRVAQKWFLDKEFAKVAWGEINSLLMFSNYCTNEKKAPVSV